MARLHGDRVVLRPLDLDDLELLFMGRSRLAAEGHLSALPDRAQLRSRLAQWGELIDGRINLGIEVDGCLVGEIQTFRQADRGLCAAGACIQVGISFYDAGARGRGLGTDAVRLFVDWLFRQGIEQVEGSTIRSNDAMRRVFERVGFVRVDEDQRGQPELLYVLTRFDWRRHADLS